MKGRVLVGTSGWSYKSWRGPFYPAKLPAREHLQFYAGRFGTAELNGVFYRTPKEETVREWAKTTPDDFVFAWKASKFITHWKRLNSSARNSLDLMETRLRLLGKKAGPVLFQLPPQMTKNRDRLAGFLRMLNPKRRYTFEFRHASWYENDILDLLRDYNVALCISDHQDAPSPWIVTADLSYVRGHGPKGDYAGRYSPRRLDKWALWIKTQQCAGITVFVYFDNDQASAAPLDAMLLSSKLEG